MINSVLMIGSIRKDSIKSTLVNEVTGVHRYEFKLSVSRKSGTKDILNIVYYTSDIPTSLLDASENNQKVKIKGYIHSRNAKIDNKMKLLISVIAKEIYIEEILSDCNQVELEGYLVKQPVYRATPLGRQITDMLLAVNHNNKSSYIPTVVWGRNAKFIANQKVGTKVKLTGRFQSRDYIKVINGEEHQMVAYELSVVSILEIETY